MSLALMPKNIKTTSWYTEKCVLFLSVPGGRLLSACSGPLFLFELPLATLL
jgi:hypothetical protein